MGKAKKPSSPRKEAPTADRAEAIASTVDAKHPSDPAIFFFRENDVAHGCFSQWYLGTFTDPESGLDFNCAEQWMMWSKAKTAGDESAMRKILETSSPRTQKALGRQVANFDAAEWDRVKFDIVVRGNWLKFSQADDAAYCGDGQEPTPLRKKLLDTGSTYLCEASPFDRIWGIGVSAVEAAETARDKWGENLLGRALCVVREQFRNEDLPSV